MLLNIVLGMCAAALNIMSAGAQSSVPLRIVTHNIRYAATSLFTGERPWSVRRPLVVDQLRATVQSPAESLLCMQEVLHQQLLDILSDLNNGSSPTEWAYIGVGRDDGKTAGEYSPIFYRPAVWTLEDFKTVWLSETPDVPSKGWDAGSIRILTIGRLTHKATSKQLVVMCTHLDNAGSVSRLNSAKIIIDRLNSFSGIATGTEPYLPVLLGGDFNSEDGQEAYEEMSKDYSPVADLKLLLPESSPNRTMDTFTGFTDSTSDDSLIDFLWIGPKNTEYWSVNDYAVLPNKINGIYNSDHRAVVADLSWR